MTSNPTIRTINCDFGNPKKGDGKSIVSILEHILSLRRERGLLSHESSVREESFRTRLDLLRYTGLSPSLMVGVSALVVMGKKIKQRCVIFPNTHRNKYKIL